MNGLLAIRIALVFAAGWGANALNDRYAPWGSHAEIAAERKETKRVGGLLLAEQLKNKTLESQKDVLQAREQTAAGREANVAAGNAVQCAATIEQAFQRGARACSAILAPSGS